MRSLYNGIVLSEDWPPRRTRGIGLQSLAALMLTSP